MQYCMQADSGMASGRYFVDSCCYKTIVRDRHLLKNVRPLTMPAFGASAEGVTADEASPGGVGTGQIIDTSLRRGPNTAATILKCIPLISVAMGLVSIIILVMAQLGAYVGDMETEVVSMLRWIAVMIFCGAGTCAWGAAKISAIIS